jgi:hypothetical protein
MMNSATASRAIELQKRDIIALSPVKTCRWRDYWETGTHHSHQNQKSNLEMVHAACFVHNLSC